MLSLPPSRTFTGLTSRNSRESPAFHHGRHSAGILVFDTCSLCKYTPLGVWHLENPRIDLAPQNPDDPVSFFSAWLALFPQALCVSYATLIWATREVEVILMFAGQMGCEALNFLLKRLIKEERPKGETRMNGYS